MLERYWIPTNHSMTWFAVLVFAACSAPGGSAAISHGGNGGQAGQSSFAGQGANAGTLLGSPPVAGFGGMSSVDGGTTSQAGSAGQPGGGGSSGSTLGDFRTFKPTLDDGMLTNPHVGVEMWLHSKSEVPAFASYPSDRIYARYYWKSIEPQNGQIDFSSLDKIIAEAKAQGGHVGFRLMTATPDFIGASPSWVKSTGCHTISFGNGNWDIDWSDPICWNLHERLVRAFGKRYDNNPVVDYVDIGSVGFWGEWHTLKQYPLPNLEIQNKIVDLYFSAFPHKIKVALVGAPNLDYQVSRGTGIRADGLGGWGSLEPNDYPKWFGAHPNVWKHAPIIGEAIHDFHAWYNPDPSKDVTSKTIDAALARHTSCFNWQDSDIAATQKTELERFIRNMGHRVVLQRIDYPSSFAPGASVPISMRWTNVGNAPPYWDYNIAFRLRQADEAVIIVTSQSIKGWLPGQTQQLDLTLSIPATLSAGAQELSIGAVEPGSKDPQIQFAITGRDPTGWYPVGQVQVIP